MIDRVLSYYQSPVAPRFLKHMIEETGLTEKQQEMVRDLRTHDGDTAFFADLAGLPKKRYCATIAAVSQRLESELLRLAQIGYAAENP